MSGFPIIDLLLGLVFIFFVLSIISSAIVEVVLTKFNYRSKILTSWLMTIFDKKLLQPDGKQVKLGQAIADHCLTTALAKEGEATAYMDSKNFVSALIEKLTFNPEKPDAPVVQSLDELLAAINNATALDGTSLLSTELRRTIMVFGSEAKMLAWARVGSTAGAPPEEVKNAFQLFREKMEAWFDSSMDRITGKMKKKYARPLTFWVGLVVVVSLNADIIDISKYLYDHQEEAKIFAGKVDESVRELNATRHSAAVLRISAATDALKLSAPAGLPLGWAGEQKVLQQEGGLMRIAGRHALGWLATVMAIMLGAPFWFDLLNKISNIRGAGTKPQAADSGREAPKK